jgi:hypothetical protein
VAHRYDVTLAVIDTKFSRRTLTVAEDFVIDKADQLAAAGATWKGSTIEPRGLVYVGVGAHPERARRILSAVADRIDIQVDDSVSGPS